MQTRYHLYLLRLILGFSDYVLLNLCFFLAYYLVDKYHVPIHEDIYRKYVLVSTVIWLISSHVFSLYTRSTITSLEAIYRATWRSVLCHGVLFIAVLFLAQHHQVSRMFILSFYALAITSFLLSRFTGTAFESKLMSPFRVRKAVAVLSRNKGGLRLAAYLEEQSDFHFYGFLGEEGFYVDDNGELLPDVAEKFRQASVNGVNEVFVSLAHHQMADAPRLLKSAEKQCIRLKFVPDRSASAAPFQLNYMGGFPVMSVRVEPLEDMRSRIKKRLFDVFVSLLAIILIISWLYPILALIIKLQSKGPVLFKQLRSGRNNEPFWCFKFRSMAVNPHSNTLQASRNDPRVTPIGRFIRRTSLDEFPQFFNVLFGNMSVVGPRPHMINHTEEYRAIVDQYMVRQFLKPGITGWAQVHGYRGEIKDPSMMQKRVEHDIWYMENWSAMLDVRIAFMTMICILKGEENAF